MIALSGWLWAIVTIAASTAQTARNAMQRDLIANIGTAGATYVRFLFALPFITVLVLVLMAGFGMAFPRYDTGALAWAASGAATQTIATFLMLAGMKTRSFSVMVAYTKTEPAMIAVIAIALMGEQLSASAMAAIAIATAGVMLMSWPRRDAIDAAAALDWRPALLGLGGGLFFALSAISYRASLLRLDTDSLLMAASSLTFVGQAMQCAAILLLLGLFNRPLLAAIGGEWRRSLFAGSMGALASLFWFMGFALTSAAKVRTLALIEVPMAMIVSRRIFKQGGNAREYAGMAMIVAGIALLLQT